jgi:hypothetical protein
MPPRREIDHLAIVREERARFPTGTPLGFENAWEVTNAVALRLAALGEDAGLHRKGGTNWKGFSIDNVAYRTGETFDCLRDGEGRGEPTWNLSGRGANWAPAVPPPGSQPTPPPDTGSEPVTPVTPGSGQGDTSAALVVVAERIAQTLDDVSAKLGEIGVRLEQIERRLTQ